MANNTTDTVTTALFKVSTVELIALLTLWLHYCCTSRWFPDQSLRILALLQSCAKIVIISLWFGVHDLAMSLFSTSILDHLAITADRFGHCQGAIIIMWMIVDTITIFFAPLRIIKSIYEATLAIDL